MASAAQDLLKIEMQKAVDEIKLRIEEEDTWFHYKLVLAGALFVAFMQYLKVTGDTGNSNKRDLDLILTSPEVSSVLALACIIALAVDIHIRNNIVVIQQMALWITHYAEPAFLQAQFTGKAVGFLPWEQFLRITDHGAGMHSDDLYGFVFYPHLHFLTWLLYVSYLGTYYRVNMYNSSSLPFVLIGFSLVHITLAMLAWVGHAAPSVFEFRLIPYRDSWLGGPRNSAVYLIPTTLIAALNLGYAWLLRKRYNGKSDESSNLPSGPTAETTDSGQ